MSEALGRGVDVNTRSQVIVRDYTGLMMAVSRDREKVVEVLLAQPGLDVNCRNDYGDAAIDFLMDKMESSIGMFRSLLAIPGLEVNAKDGAGFTPLMVAVQEGQE